MGIDLDLRKDMEQFLFRKICEYKTHDGEYMFYKVYLWNSNIRVFTFKIEVIYLLLEEWSKFVIYSRKYLLNLYHVCVWAWSVIQSVFCGFTIGSFVKDKICFKFCVSNKICVCREGLRENHILQAIVVNELWSKTNNILLFPKLKLPLRWTRFETVDANKVAGSSKLPLGWTHFGLLMPTKLQRQKFTLMY